MDIERLVEQATKAILERLNSQAGAKVAAFGDIPAGLISGAEIKPANTPADIEGCDYIVMSTAAFNAIHGGGGAGAAKPGAGQADTAQCGCKTIDLGGKRLIHERDLRDANAARGDTVKVSGNAIITALAHDYAKGIGARFQKE